MDQLLQQQHAQPGTANFSSDQMKGAMGGILSLLQTKLSKADFQKIQAAIPETSTLVSQAETTHAQRAEAGGGATGGGGGGGGNAALLSTAMGFLSGGGGGGGGNNTSAGGTNTTATSGEASPIQSIMQLMGFLGKLGITPQQALAFLPLVVKFLQQNANVDTTSALTGAGGSGAGVAGASVASSTAGTGASSTGTTPTAGGTSGGGGNNNNNNNNDAMGNLINQAAGFLGHFGKK